MNRRRVPLDENLPVRLRQASLGAEVDTAELIDGLKDRIE
jgi:hypothetical protein